MELHVLVNFNMGLHLMSAIEKLLMGAVVLVLGMALHGYSGTPFRSSFIHSFTDSFIYSLILQVLLLPYYVLGEDKRRG